MGVANISPFPERETDTISLRIYIKDGKLDQVVPEHPWEGQVNVQAIYHEEFIPGILAFLKGFLATLDADDQDAEATAVACAFYNQNIALFNGAMDLIERISKEGDFSHNLCALDDCPEGPESHWHDWMRVAGFRAERS